VHIKRSLSVFTSHSLNIIYRTIFCNFQHVVLVGGFAASDWLFSKVFELLTPLGINIVRPENHVWVFFKIKTTSYSNFVRNKAVSDGAISFYLDHFVRTRVSKFTYGSFCTLPYDPNDPDHQSRSHKVFTDEFGDKRVDGCFDIILPKVSCLFPFLESMLFFLNCRIPKFRRRKNSGNLITCLQILLIYKMFMNLFGVTVETSWPQSGKTLMPVRLLSQSSIWHLWWANILQIITRNFVL
jgi:hypothetical protein